MPRKNMRYWDVPYPLLRKAMVAKGIYNISQLCRAINVPTSAVGMYTAIAYGHTKPYTRWNRWKNAAHIISEFFQYPPQDLFAEENSGIIWIEAWRCPNFPLGPCERVFIPGYQIFV